MPIPSRQDQASPWRPSTSSRPVASFMTALSTRSYQPAPFRLEPSSRSLEAFRRAGALVEHEPPMAGVLILPPEPSPEQPPRLQSRNALDARFRVWRERSLPRAAYQLQPNFWTAHGLSRASHLAPNERRMVKRGEPQLTGMAYTARSLYLVQVAGAGTYQHIAKLMHVRSLVRDDPDYSGHQGRRVSLILLADRVPAAIADFARRHRIRVITTTAN